MDDVTTIPAPPPRLKADGERLWREAVAAFDLRPDELARLAAAARTADELARLEAALARAAVLITGSTAQKKVHPLFAALVAHRTLLNKLLADLGFADAAVGADAGQERSSAGRKMAGIRWHGERR